MWGASVYIVYHRELNIRNSGLQCLDQICQPCCSFVSVMDKERTHSWQIYPKSMWFWTCAFCVIFWSTTDSIHVGALGRCIPLTASSPILTGLWRPFHYWVMESHIQTVCTR